MKIRKIVLGPEETPERLTVEMSMREAVFIARVVGRLNGQAADEILPGSAMELATVYDGISSGICNRFWSDGIDGAVRDLAKE